MPKPFSNPIIDQGKINKILALTVDMSDPELSILIDRLREVQWKRKVKRAINNNLDTIQG